MTNYKGSVEAVKGGISLSGDIEMSQQVSNSIPQQAQPNDHNKEMDLDSSTAVDHPQQNPVETSQNKISTDNQTILDEEIVDADEDEAEIDIELETGADKKRQDLNVDKKSETKKQQPSFVHKLYSMLEEPSIDSLIRWHENGSNFLMCPNEDFTNNLRNYFKHGNIASFIRQLNMYGFHKVNDSYHSSSTVVEDLNDQSTDSNEKGKSANHPIWEFKHSSGVFKKGNIEALSLIKRRSFKNTSDKDGNNLKLTYDIMPNTQMQQKFHQSDYQAFPPNQMQQNMLHSIPSHQIIEYQQQPQQPPFQPQHPSQPHPQPISQIPLQQQQMTIPQPMQFQQPIQPEIQKQVSGMPNNDFEIVDERPSISMSHSANQIMDQERLSMNNSIKELQQLNQGLSAKFNELSHKTDQLLKFNDLYKEELSNVNYDFVGILDIIKNHASKQANADTPTSSSNQLILMIEDIRSKILQRSAYRDMNIKNIVYQYSNQSQSVVPPNGAPISVPNSAVVPAPVVQSRSATALPNMMNTPVSQAAFSNYTRNLSTASVSSNPYYNANYPSGPTAYSYFPDPQQQAMYTRNFPGSQSNFSSSNKVPSVKNMQIQRSGSTVQQIASAASKPTNGEEPPFLHKDIRYSVSLSSGRSRNHSVYDPLQPLPCSQGPNNNNNQSTNQSTNQAGVQSVVTQPGVNQFYSVTGGPHNTGYPNNENGISRQYSSTQVYSPMGVISQSPSSIQRHESAVEKEEIAALNNGNVSSNSQKKIVTSNAHVRALSNCHTTSNLSSPLHRNSDSGNFGSTNKNISKNGHKGESRNGSLTGLNLGFTGLSEKRRNSSISNVKSPSGKSKSFSYGILNATRSGSIREVSLEKDENEDNSKDKAIPKDREVEKKNAVYNILNHEEDDERDIKKIKV